MAARVELAEHIPGVTGSVLDLDPQRGRPGRARQPERLDLDHGQPELVGQRIADRLATAPAHIQVSAAATPVNDREDLAGHKQPVRSDRDRHTDHRTDQHIGRSVDAQAHPGQRERRDQARRDPLAELPPAARRDQRVQHPDQGRGENRHRPRRHRPAGPAAAQIHPKRPRAVHRRQPDRHQDRQERPNEHDQMAETPQHQQRHQNPPAHNADHGSRTSGGHNRLHQTGQARQVQPGQPAHHRVIPHRDRHAQAAPGRAKHNLGQRDKHHRRGHPPQAGAMNATRQRWRLTGGTPPPTRPPDIRRTRDRRARTARGHPPRDSSHAVILRPNRPPVHPPGRQPTPAIPPGRLRATGWA